MRVLLLKDVGKVGNLGDVVEVKTAYARNYLFPRRLAAEPTEENLRAIEAERKRAAAERAARLKAFTELAEQARDVSITIEAAANPEGTLYGSVGPKEIADALHARGLAVLPEHVQLAAPIRTLDNCPVTLKFAENLTAEIKVWIVREGAVDHASQAGQPHPDESGQRDAPT